MKKWENEKYSLYLHIKIEFKNLFKLRHLVYYIIIKFYIKIFKCHKRIKEDFSLK